MQLGQFLPQENVFCLSEPLSRKHDLLSKLAQLTEKTLFYNQKIVFDALCERERLGSTGLGSGVAIPHIRLVGLQKMVSLFVKLDTPVPYQSLDQAPVDLVCFLLAPATTSSYSSTDHLRALATVSRLFREKVLCAQLRAAATPEELRPLLFAPAVPEAPIAVKVAHDAA